MKRTSVWTAVLLFASSAAASAQIKVENILATGPVNLSTSADFRFTGFGQYAVVDVAASATLRNAQGIINAMIPDLNKALDCGKAKYGAAISSIGLGSSNLLARISSLGASSNSFDITMDATVFSCPKKTLRSGIEISATIKPGFPGGNLVLNTDKLTVSTTGVWGYVPIAGNYISYEASVQVSPRSVMRSTQSITGWRKQFRCRSKSRISSSSSPDCRLQRKILTWY
jgi:hypothetical protein